VGKIEFHTMCLKADSAAAAWAGELTEK